MFEGVKKQQSFESYLDTDGIKKHDHKYPAGSYQGWNRIKSLFMYINNFSQLSNKSKILSLISVRLQHILNPFVPIHYILSSKLLHNQGVTSEKNCLQFQFHLWASLGRALCYITLFDFTPLTVLIIVFNSLNMIYTYFKVWSFISFYSTNSNIQKSSHFNFTSPLNYVNCFSSRIQFNQIKSQPVCQIIIIAIECRCRRYWLQKMT